MIDRRNVSDVGGGCAIGLTMCLIITILITLGTVVWGILISLAWNVLLPTLLGWPTIGILEGIAIAILLAAVGGIFGSRK